MSKNDLFYPEGSFYANVVRRKNVIRDFLFDAALKIASYPRLVLEVFIRKNFGVRYFSFASAFTVAFILWVFPAIFETLKQPLQISYDGGYVSGADPKSFRSHYLSWYIFIVLFLGFSIFRYYEKRRNNASKFKRYSLYNGDMLSFLLDMKIFGVYPKEKLLVTLIEPALFFIPGFILIQFGQNVGYLFIVCSIIYGLSYLGEYKKGNDFIHDKIDEMLMNEELENIFVNDLPPDKTRGVRFYVDKPKAKVVRKDLLDKMNSGSVESEEISYAE
jgi:hypothetical protein